MLQPPHKLLINPDELFASREIGLQDRSDSQYSLLIRLCADFNFSVLQLQRKTFSHLSCKTVPNAPEFVLATHDEQSQYWFSISPGMTSLKQLNDYAKHYEVDILHLQLFGDEPDLYQASDNYY